MKWILQERKPDMIVRAGQEVYLGQDGSLVSDQRRALRFPTREAAEAYRRSLAHRYDWVAVSSDA